LNKFIVIIPKFLIFEYIKKMVKAQQDCIDTYLEDCILETTENVADTEARKEIKEFAEQINNIAYDIENT
jgi:hypothetical protein